MPEATAGPRAGGGAGGVSGSRGPVPGLVVAGDREVREAGAAAVADELAAGEEEEADVDGQDGDHDEEEGGGHGDAPVAEERRDDTHEGAEKGEDDDEAGDLRKGLLAEEFRAAAGEALPEATGVIDGAFPVQEKITIRAVGTYPGGSSVELEGDVSEGVPFGIAEEQPHPASVAEVGGDSRRNAGWPRRRVGGGRLEACRIWSG